MYIKVILCVSSSLHSKHFSSNESVMCLLSAGNVSLSRSGLVQNGCGFPVHSTHKKAIDPAAVNFHLLPTNTNSSENGSAFCVPKPTRSSEWKGTSQPYLHVCLPNLSTIHLWLTMHCTSSHSYVSTLIALEVYIAKTRQHHHIHSHTSYTYVRAPSLCCRCMCMYTTDFLLRQFITYTLATYIHTRTLY